MDYGFFKRCMDCSFVCRNRLQWNCLYPSDCGTEGFSSDDFLSYYESGIGVLGIGGMGVTIGTADGKRSGWMYCYLCSGDSGTGAGGKLEGFRCEEVEKRKDEYR